MLEIFVFSFVPFRLNVLKFLYKKPEVSANLSHPYAVVENDFPFLSPSGPFPFSPHSADPAHCATSGVSDNAMFTVAFSTRAAKMEVQVGHPSSSGLHTHQRMMGSYFCFRSEGRGRQLVASCKVWVIMTHLPPPPQTL